MMECKNINPRLEGIDFNNQDLMQECLKKISLDIEEKKTAIVKERLTQLGIKIDFELERERRFNLICIERGNGLDETFYYNDGSKYGIRIVTFTESEPKFPDKIERSEIKMSFNYY